ncbi:MAG: GntR family transcriptional regulator [Marmoricola sp.]
MRELSKSPRDGRPLPVRVYEELRDLIVDGTLQADTQLVQEQLAEALGVSRTPVRDALNRLAHEELVTWNPGRGYLVNGLSGQEVSEVYEVRRLLEVEATRLAAPRLDSVVTARLNALIEEMAATSSSDVAAQFDLNRRFHLTLVKPCHNRQLLKMLDSLWDHPVNRRITRSYLQQAGSTDAMVAEHREILRAAEAGETEALTALVEEHLTSGYDEAGQAVAR